MTHTLTCWLLTWPLLIINPSHGFSSQSSNDIKIVGLPGGNIESLPGMYVQTFRRWIVQDNDNTDDDDHLTSTGMTTENYSLQTIEPIAGAGLHNFPYDEGWVDPTTTKELWWPKDIPTLQTRPTLNVLFKGGILSYVSMGLDVRVPHPVDDGCPGGDDVVVTSWRNYGLNSQPIARQWTTLTIAMEKMFHVEGFLLRGGGGGFDNGAEEGGREVLFPSLNVESVLGKVANFIAQMDPLSPLAEGFHIVSFPMRKVWVDLPSLEEEGGGDGSYKIVCLATSEPFASKLLDLDEGLLEMSSTSVLEVDVVRTEEGGKSPYLTEPYKRLYLKSS
ncbi:hypothetical protein HJC23_000665 [Cyclotella cryptica]|uniref:Uncharacterized protein n=1 Tax=Cyclotella cryptica TaxID=29204 RepID=A0ABD3Q842_9STRA|eukprot:CCRYP_008075-RA/>CCRYP_008075-RA protein AED:0.00 eAED:0.00 QI:245/-1/1/1/-1/1/1/126/331